LLVIPNTSTQTVLSISTSTGSGTLLGSFVTAAGVPNNTSFIGGLWTLYTFIEHNSGGSTFRFWTEVQEVASNGTTVLQTLATGTYASGTPVSTSTVSLHTYDLYVPAATLASVSSRLLLNVYVQAQSGSPTASLYMRGNTQSHLTTTIAYNVSGPTGPTGPTGATGPTIYPGVGIAVSTGSAWGTSLADPLTVTHGGTGLSTLTAANYALYSTSSTALTAGTLPVAAGGTNASTASITSFNNITGYSAAGATGTTTTNLVFSTSPTITTLTTSGNVTATGTAARFIADFDNATVNSRFAFQTTTTNASTGIYALPNGSSTAASWQATNAADPTNASKILIATNASTDVQLVSGINGSGTYLPLSIYTSGGQSAQFSTTKGTFTLGVAGTAQGILQVTGATSGTVSVQGAAAAGTWTMTLPTSGGSSSQFLQTNGSGTTTWATPVAQATGGGSDQIFWNNGQTVTTDYSIPATTNAGSFGPITINNSVTVTVPSGSNWTVV
jgi:hypothetical protein